MTEKFSLAKKSAEDTQSEPLTGQSLPRIERRLPWFAFSGGSRPVNFSESFQKETVFEPDKITTRTTRIRTIKL